MQPMTAARTVHSIPEKRVSSKPQRRDPAPSRWAYRINRLWLTPLYRALLRVGLPVFVILTAVGWYVSNPTNRFAIEEKVTEMRESIESRPEFAVKLMAVEGASPVVDSAIRDMLPLAFPLSSFDLDLDTMQAKVASLDVIETVDLRVRPGGVLEVLVTERDPVVLWRNAGGIDMLDASGHRVASLTERAGRPDLPLIAGKGANGHVREALALLDAAAPISPRLRGLVRVGERRWNLVLDRDQTILLPETAPVAALEQVLALNEAQDLLERDLTDIDMRNPARPTLRMTAPAVAELRTIRSLQSGDPSR